MFNRRKEREEKLQNTLEDIREQIDAQQQAVTRFDEELHRGNEQMKEQVSRHNANIDNLIDVIDEKLEELTESRKQRMRQHEQEMNMLALVEEYARLLFTLERTLCAAPDGDAWKEQFKIMEASISGKCGLCGISLIRESGMLVDPNIHEISGTEEVLSDEDHGKVLTVLEPGIIYMGEVRKKAKVIAGKRGEAIHE